MRLLTHNFLRNNNKHVVNGYPLRITATEIEVTENPYSEAFIKHILPTLDWNVLCMVSPCCPPPTSLLPPR